ncbi:hypothetical protein [Nocardioides euryhalodurans]|uniref:Uncharacterized protein n=1 Tax=Nocardioides euryhalodurans TaxID=2518370 RepID=A0A4P7GM52_9ACTN|nr:hypothetical protein [Nocardioides euryhalodurans]QBR93225.1 hypothetical protein EXE57_13855 [Nocardioides euryhalodurans]
MNLMEELERAVPPGPPLPSVDARLAAGRRALVRRRLAGAVGTLAVVAALGGTAWAVTPAEDRASRGPEIATDPTPSPTQVTEPPWEDATPVRYVDGELEVRPGVVVHERLENPYDFAPPRRSDAFDLTFRGQRQWVILTGGPENFGLSSTLPSQEWEDFGAYVESQATALAGDGRWRDALRLAEDGTVVASPGSQVLQRTDDPRLGDAFAPPGTPTGLALVSAAGSREVSVVAWRVVDGVLEVFRVPPGDVVGATFEELQSYVRGLYARGEGLG